MLGPGLSESHKEAGAGETGWLPRRKRSSDDNATSWKVPVSSPTVAECSRLDTGKDQTPTLPNCTKGRLIEQETKPNVGKGIREEQSAAKKTEEERSRIHK